MSRVVYSASRRAKLRGWSTCHRKLKLSSTFFDGAHQGPGEQCQPHRPHHAAADVAGELHHARRELGRRRAADRAKELVDDRLQVTVPAEDLEYGETEGEQRDERQEPTCTPGSWRAG